MARLTDTRVAAIKPPPIGQEEHSDDLVAGLRLRVGAGGRKAWIVRTRAGGKPINKTLGSYPIFGLADARTAARELLLDIAKNGGVRTVHTFGELAEHWVQNVARPNNRSAPMIERRLDLHILPHWRDKDIATIRRGDVRDLVDGVPGDITPNRVLTLIRTLFRHAMSRDWIEASPAEAIAKPKQEMSRDRFLGMEEARRVYVTADALGYPLAGYIRTLLLTGQRRTEVAAMRWTDIDLDAGTWTIASENTKSGRGQVVPLSAPVLALLNAAPRICEYVWTTDGRTHVTGYTHVKVRLDRILAAQGTPLNAWTLHDLRRTVATHMVRLGVSETIVGRVLNHAAQGVTAKVYALHAYAPEKRSALDRWAAELTRAGEKAGKVVKLRG